MQATTSDRYTQTVSRPRHARKSLVAAGAAPGLFWLGWLLTGIFRAGFPPLTAFQIALALAITISGALAFTVWAKPGFWFALTLAGNASLIQTIGAGHLPRFQHFRSPGELGSPWSWVVAILLTGQLIAVAVGAFGVLPLHEISRRRRTSVLILAGMAAGSAFVSRDFRGYAFETGFYLLFELVCLANVALIVYSLPQGADCLILRIWDLRLSRRAPIVAAFFVTMITALLGYFVYGNHPHIPDEVSYLIQARHFSAGHLTMPIPPALDAFRLDLITYESTRWYSPFPPGWPLLLMAGAWAGLPFLINPILAGVATLLIWLFVRDVYGERTAGTALLLLCSSPWFLFLSMSLMSHLSLLVFAMISICAAMRFGSGRRWMWALVAGGAAGFASTIRPLDALILAGMVGLWLLLRKRSEWRLAIRGVVLFGLGCVLIAASVFPYNQHLTGRATKFPVDDYFDRSYGPGVNSLGFGPNKGMNWPIDPFPGHGLRDVVVNTALNVASTNVELFGWGTGSLVPLLALFLLGASRWDRIMLVPLAVVPAALSLYWYHGGPEFGARYWFLILPFCVALAANTVERLRAHTAVIALCVITLCVYVPWRATDKYNYYLMMSPEVKSLAIENHFGRDLILVRGQQHPDYASAAAYNPIELSGNAPIYVWDVNADARRQAIAAFPDRPVWIVDGPTLTGGHFRVELGPVPGSELIAASR